MTENMRKTVCITDVDADCTEGLCSLFPACDSVIKIVSLVTGIPEENVVDALRNDEKLRSMVIKWNEESAVNNPTLTALCFLKRSKN